MARVQVLRLPPTSTDEAPFLLVFDRCVGDEMIEAFDSGQLRKLAKRTGARTAIVFEGTLDVA